MRACGRRASSSKRNTLSWRRRSSRIEKLEIQQAQKEIPPK